MSDNDAPGQVLAVAMPLPAAEFLPAPDMLDHMLNWSGHLVKSGLLPDHIRTREAALAIMLKGRELGLTASYALSHLYVIGGKPAAMAEVMAAMIFKHHGDRALVYVESTAERCTLEYRRRSWAEPQQLTFTMEDAATAELLGNKSWKKYPAAMLRARAVSAVARMAFPDVLGGMYTPEELGAEVTVDAEGRMVYDVPVPEPRHQPQREPAAPRRARPAPERADDVAQAAAMMTDEQRAERNTLGKLLGMSGTDLRNVAQDIVGRTSGLTEAEAEVLNAYLRQLNAEREESEGDTPTTVEVQGDMLAAEPDPDMEAVGHLADLQVDMSRATTTDALQAVLEKANGLGMANHPQVLHLYRQNWERLAHPADEA